MNQKFHALTSDEVLGLLGSSVTGLSSAEAEKRAVQYGPNSLPKEKRLSAFVIFAHQFASPLIYILLIALVIKLISQSWVDVIVIGAAVVINAVIGFFQEYKAEKSLEALKGYLVQTTTVIRDGQKLTIESSKLVPGDIVEMYAGSSVPADMRIIEAFSVEVNEAPLTGESSSVRKNINVVSANAVIGDQKNMLFMGTQVVSGQGIAVVVATGAQTQLGGIAQLLKTATPEHTPLQQSIQNLGRILTFAVTIIAFLIILVGFIYQLPLSQIFETAVAVAVAVVPEGLVISITVILAIGMQKMVRDKALVRKLVATETLGSATVICTDKTGTLTEGRMASEALFIGTGVREFFTLHKDSELSISQFDDIKRCVEAAVICNDASFSAKGEGVGDSTEVALLQLPEWFGLSLSKIRQAYQRQFVIPFDSLTKYMAVISTFDDDHNIIFVKGAVDHMVPLCAQTLYDGEEKPFTAPKKKFVLQMVEEQAATGLRTLGFAYAIVEKTVTTITAKDLKKLTYLGFAGLRDPLRKESRATYLLTSQAGIRTIIITGDHKATASSIASQMGMQFTVDQIFEGADLIDATDDELDVITRRAVVFARVQPAQKMDIVESLKRQGEVVAMIGDGVNDAPALKASDIGVSVGSGTDVAKEASDMVLLDDNYKTIALAIKQGRILFDNIKKTTLYLLVSSFTEVMLVVLAILAGLPLPLTALQILYINIVSDGFPHLTLGFEAGDEAVMTRKPKKLGEGILSKEIKGLVFGIGLFLDIILFAIYVYLYKQGYALAEMQTIIFMILGLGSILYIFSCKSLTHSLLTTKLFDNMYMWYAVIAAFAIHLGAYFIPVIHKALGLAVLTPFDWCIVAGVIVIKIVGIELGKMYFFGRKNQTVIA